MFVNAKKLLGKSRALTLVEILGVLVLICVGGAQLGHGQVRPKAPVKMPVHAAQLPVHAAEAQIKKSGLVRKPPPVSWKENEYIVMFKAGTKNAKAHAKRLAKLGSGSVLHDYYGPFLGTALRIAD